MPLSPSFELKDCEIPQTSYSILISHIDLLSFSSLLQMWKNSRLSDLLHTFSMLSFDGPVQVPTGWLATTPPLPTLSLLIEARLAERTTPVQRAYMHVPEA